MKSGFAKDKFRPFIVQLFKPVGQVCMVGTVGDRDRRLDKKSVLKKFDVVPYAVGIKDLKAIVDFLALLVNKGLQGWHHVKFGVQPVPQKSLVSHRYAIFTNIPRKFFFCLAV